MDHNLTEYRVVVTGDRCGRTRTYTVRSAWMDVVVAAAIASEFVVQLTGELLARGLRRFWAGGSK